MTHPKATHAAAAPGHVPAVNQAGSKWCDGVYAAGLSSAAPESDFYSPLANLLEMPSAGFHYSVIAGASRTGMAPGLIDCHLLDDEVTACSFRADGADGADGANAGQEQVTDDAPDQIEPVAASNGGRKINAKDRDFVGSMQVDITVARIRMMRIAGNIHATYPQYASVAPILQRSVRANATGRGTTPNTTGAAA